MAELGKIERPPAESFGGRRKLYFVPNIYSHGNAPEEYKALVGRYWDEVAQQLDKIEAAGKVKRVFCESISEQGEEALSILDKSNEPVSRIVRKKVEEGAVLVPLERDDIFGPLMDWSNCLAVVRTDEVYQKVIEFYKDLYERRLQHIQHEIGANLSGEEAGLLIMGDQERAGLQLPGDIEVFLVTPPSYDDLLRWLREKRKGGAGAEKE